MKAKELFYILLFIFYANTLYSQNDTFESFLGNFPNVEFPLELDNKTIRYTSYENIEEVLVKKYLEILVADFNGEKILTSACSYIGKFQIKENIWGFIYKSIPIPMAGGKHLNIILNTVDISTYKIIDKEVIASYHSEHLVGEALTFCTIRDDKTIKISTDKSIVTTIQTDNGMEIAEDFKFSEHEIKILNNGNLELVHK